MSKENRANPELAMLHERAAQLLTRIATSTEPPSLRDRSMASIYAQVLDKRHERREVFQRRLREK